jgi:hypothetical protein
MSCLTTSGWTIKHDQQSAGRGKCARRRYVSKLARIPKLELLHCTPAALNI